MFRIISCINDLKLLNNDECNFFILSKNKNVPDDLMKKISGQECIFFENGENYCVIRSDLIKKLISEKYDFSSFYKEYDRFRSFFTSMFSCLIIMDSYNDNSVITENKDIGLKEQFIMYTDSPLDSFSGISNFNTALRKNFGSDIQIVCQDADVSHINNCSVLVDFYRTWNISSARNFNNKLKQLKSQKNKLLFIVHEINQYSYSCLQKADFIIYITKYQEFVSNKLMNINKPFETIGCLPRKIRPFNREIKKGIYLGGHYNYSESAYLKILKIIHDLLNRFDEDIIINAIDRNMSPDYMKLITSIINNKKIKDRIIIHNGFSSIDDYYRILSSCQYVYHWRDGLSYDDLVTMYSKSRFDLIYHRLGDSGFLRDSLECRLNVLVENSSRFASYFDNIVPPTYEQLSHIIKGVM